jgi:hypothetical protein
MVMIMTISKRFRHEVSSMTAYISAAIEPRLLFLVFSI